MNTNEEEPGDRSLDILGIKPVAHAVEVAVDKAADFLALICRPAAQEFGLLFGDTVRVMRANNARKLVARAEKIHRERGIPASYHAHPRVVSRILEEGSWVEEDNLQEMWAGLLVSTCSPDGKDDSNLIFSERLSQMTSSQVQILNYACVEVRKHTSTHGLIAVAERLRVSPQVLKSLTSKEDLHEIDLDLDQLHSLDLTEGGFTSATILNEFVPDDAEITPTTIALNMYVRCQGYKGSVLSYYRLDSNNSQSS